jgi:hypothetical protein
VRAWSDTRDAERSAVCVCGWAGVFDELKAAQAAYERHAAEGCEGCDHVVSIEDVKKR